MAALSLSVLNLEFMLGVLAALVHGRESPRIQTGMLITGGGVLAITMLFMMYADMAACHRLGLALGLTVLMLGMVDLEQNKAIAWPMPLLALGNASYSIYLIHSPLLSLMQRVFGRFDLTWPLALLLGVVLSVGFGYLYFLWIERRVVRLVRVWSQQILFRTKK